jgi:hypothetical protein
MNPSGNFGSLNLTQNSYLGSFQPLAGESLWILGISESDRILTSAPSNLLLGKMNPSGYLGSLNLTQITRLLPTGFSPITGDLNVLNTEGNISDYIANGPYSSLYSY